MTMKVSQLQEESWLRTEVQRLAEDNEDLRGSAQAWIRMYEQLLRHYSSRSLGETGALPAVRVRIRMGDTEQGAAPPTEAPTSQD
jgi:hypothetical protein